MEERSKATICERGNDLIAFVYGEVDGVEARDFERHLKTCGVCEKEFNSFRQIRESIVAWRQESLGIVPATRISPNPEVAVFKSQEPKKPSALAAIRGFLDLSPLWMKAAAAFASVLFCVAIVLFVVRLFDKPAPAVVSGDKRYTETELQAIVEAAVAKERNLNPKSEAPTPSMENRNGQPGIERTLVDRPGQIVLTTSHRAGQRPLTKSEREQLAADLRLISPVEETDFELLGDRINR